MTDAPAEDSGEHGGGPPYDLASLHAIITGPYQGVHQHLYDCLSILDSKASSLLAVNAVIMAVQAVLLDPVPTPYATIVLGAGIAAVTWSSIILLRVITVRWTTGPELAAMVDAQRAALAKGLSPYEPPAPPLVTLLSLRDDRTRSFESARALAMASVVALAAAFALQTLMPLANS
jgi:hypothetical protein